jgi:hypothetical protein
VGDASKWDPKATRFPFVSRMAGDAGKLPRMRSAIRAWNIVASCVLCGAFACGDPPSPLDAEIPPACDACLTGGTDAGVDGCGIHERACSADMACEQSMICILQFDCLEGTNADGCTTQHDCTPPAGESATRLSAFEACARTTCADPCHFQ